MGFSFEDLGNKVDTTIAAVFHKLGLKVATRPKTTIVLTLLFAAICASGLSVLKTENRPEKLWSPQNTRAEMETKKYKATYPSARISNILITSDDADDTNVLTKASLVSAMKLHGQIEDGKSTTDGDDYALVDLCFRRAACANSTIGVCECFINSILGEWNYNLTTLQNDNDFLATLNAYGKTTQDLIDQLGNAAVKVDSNGNENVESAEAFRISYFLKNNGKLEDPITEAWEKDVFLSVLQSEDVETDYPGLTLNYLTFRSFSDEFGSAISGDITFVQISYLIAFIFLGATLGRFCGSGSRWAVSLCALVLVGISTLAGIGLSSYFGLFYGPIHSLLPFVLLGIGLDDVFVIVNAFNRERKVARGDEGSDQLIQRSATASARSGASITVTSLTDMVAFAISSSSALPALGSFCAYAAVSVLLLWLFAATFFLAVVVLDEKRQRGNKWDVLCCFKRKGELPKDEGYQENYLSTYFRKYHAPAILNTVWNKIGVMLIFAGLFAFGIYGAVNLSVEDSQRNFIPDGSYINDFIAAGDRYTATGATSIDVYVVFEDGKDIYEKRDSLAQLRERVKGLSAQPPYIAEPNSAESYQNVMTGLAAYLDTDLGESNTEKIGIQLGNDNWPTTYSDFITTLKFYIGTPEVPGPGRRYSRDINFVDNSDPETDITLRVYFRYIKLTKESRGNTIDDAERQIEAMDATRDLVEEWGREGELPFAYAYSSKFLDIEGFKIIRTELFRNAGLAVMAVGVITFISLGNIVTAFLITINVIFCIVEILGFMFIVGIVIDSISVINIVLAVGLSVDYSAHVGHCFMVKSGDRNMRATEALADIGASVLNGALSTFLAVAVLLGSSSYVFKTLSVQFALTVGLGVGHGLILLPVLLSIFGPKPFASAVEHEKAKGEGEEDSQ